MWKKFGENRLRETPGLFYDDIVVGLTYEHRPGRTITETDNSWFTLLTMNQHPAHIDSNFAKNTEFGKILVNSALTFSIVNGMTVQYLSYNCIANLGWNNVKFIHPVYVADTLYAESKVISKRLSQSRLNQGIVSIHTIGLQQNGEVVMICDRTFLMPKKTIQIEYDLNSRSDINLNED